MKINIGKKEKELIILLNKIHKTNNVTKKSEALKALETGSRTVVDQGFLWKLGNDLRDIRLSRKISQRQLAKQLNTSPANLRRIEKGERSVSVVNLFRILKELNSDYCIIHNGVELLKEIERKNSYNKETSKKTKRTKSIIELNREYLKQENSLSMDVD